MEAVNALAKHIRSTNRAYAMAEVAHMVLAAGDRYRVIFRVKSEGGGANEKTAKDRQPSTFRLVRCKTDGSVWLSRDEAVAHFLNTPELLGKFYEIEEVTTEAPKGNFSVIAMCGLSGTILGPPNHHEYQQKIVNLHRSRFANMPLEKFKSRIEMRRDEEIIEQWKEQMSTSRHYRVQTEKSEVSSKSQKENIDQTLVVEETNSATAEENLPVEEIPSEESTSTDEVSSEELAEESVTETSDDPTGAETEAEPASEEQNEESEKEKIEASELSGDESPEAQESETAEEDNSAITVDENSPANDTPESEPAITSMAELTRHFRENYARRIFKEVGEVKLPGTISKKELSSALCERMNAEINWQKRGFPLPMVRLLCRRFEHQGLKFFKRGAKALFVSASRPRALAEDTVLTDRLLQMLNHINEHPGTLAGDLIKHLQGDTAAKPDGNKDTPETPAEPTKEELAMLADLRWLVAEGYLIEFPSSELIPGTAVSVDKRKRRPAKRAKKKAPAKKTAAAAKTSSEESSIPPETSEAPAPAPKESDA